METEIIIALVIAALLIAAAVITQLKRPQDRAVTFSNDALDQKVKLYREAIQRGTLCERCLTANAGGSRYCADCGKILAA
jgi:hypothetical protein